MSESKKDWNAEGQHDREKSRDNDFSDILVRGGSSPNYNPPSDKESKDQYNAGWKNGTR